jgi:hypothetical protein
MWAENARLHRGKTHRLAAARDPHIKWFSSRFQRTLYRDQSPNCRGAPLPTHCFGILNGDSPFARVQRHEEGGYEVEVFRFLQSFRNLVKKGYRCFRTRFEKSMVGIRCLWQSQERPESNVQCLAHCTLDLGPRLYLIRTSHRWISTRL